ncbi:unnamed protein product, partial [marine sediment metagenome]
EAVTIEGVPADFTFETNLKQTDTGDDVKYLQIVLNSDSETQLAEEGVGSPGEETSYFGPLTKAAVIAFQELYTEDVLASWGLTEGTGFVGSTTRAKLNSLLAAAEEEEEEEEEEEVPAEGLSVALSAVTPVSASIVADTTSGDGAQALIAFLKVSFTASAEGPAKVTTLKVTRGGISADADLSNVYLYDGGTRLAEFASFTSRVITFTDSAGLFTVEAETTKSITVKADLANGTSSGKTINLNINAATDITSDASEISGTFPITGNTMSTAS